MPKPEIQFLSKNTLAWRVMSWISKPFATKAIVARDIHGRSREQFIADLVNNGLGPEATVEGRGHATNMFAYAVPIAVTAAWLPLSAISLGVREAGDTGAARDLLVAVWLFLLPITGLVVPLAWRFWLARRQLRGWIARGKPSDERPSNRSLPRGRDVLVGLSIGGMLNVIMLFGIAAS